MVWPRARAPARANACPSACGRPPCWVQPRVTTSPVVSSAMTARTAGLGAVRPSIRRASCSASCMKRRSIALAGMHSGRTMEGSVLPVGCLDADGIGRGRARLAVARTALGDLAQHLLEVGGLAEIAIDRGEAHISYGVEALQGLHDELANRGGRHLLLPHTLELAHNARDHALDALGWNRPLAHGAPPRA